MYFSIDEVNFLATYHCTGKCAHCPICDKVNKTGMTKVDPLCAREVLESITKLYDVKTVNIYGGEPLLYPETTVAIIKAATDCGVKERNLITNGYFSKNISKLSEVANKIVKAGVTQILLAVDGFHEETIPSDTVANFADAVLDTGFQDIYLHPTWLSSREAKNEANFQTTMILERFADSGLEITDGCTVEPIGNALTNFREFFPRGSYDLDDFGEKFDDIHSITINPDGEVEICGGFVIGNIYKDSIEKILASYNPTKDRIMNTIYKGGIKNFAQYAENKGLSINLADYSSAKEAWRDICKQLDEMY